jgi:hypothetical protein
MFIYMYRIYKTFKLIKSKDGPKSDPKWGREHVTPTENVGVTCVVSSSESFIVLIN